MLNRKIHLLFVLFFLAYTNAFATVYFGFQKRPQPYTGGNNTLGSIVVSPVSSQVATRYSHILEGHKVQVVFSNQKKILPGDILLALEGHTIFEESDLKKYVKESDFYKIKFGRIATSGVIGLKTFEHSIYIEPLKPLVTPDIFKLVKGRKGSSGIKWESFVRNSYLFATKQNDSVFVLATVEGGYNSHFKKFRFTSVNGMPQFTLHCDDTFELYRPDFVTPNKLIELSSGKVEIYDPKSCRTQEISIPGLSSSAAYSKVGILPGKQGLFFTSHKGKTVSLWNQRGQLVIQERADYSRGAEKALKKHKFRVLREGSWTRDIINLKPYYIVQDKITGKDTKLYLKCSGNSKGKKYFDYQLFAETANGDMPLTSRFALVDKSSGGCDNGYNPYVILDMENDNKLDVLFFGNPSHSMLFVPDIYDAS